MLKSHLPGSVERGLGFANPQHRIAQYGIGRGWGSLESEMMAGMSA